MTKAMDVSEIAFPAEDLLRPFAREAKRSWEWAQELDDLGNVIVVFAILGARLRVEEIIARDQFEDLYMQTSISFHIGSRRGEIRPTMAAMLHTSVLAPHLEPRITSGERYCRVWMSLVKWWPTQHAFPKSAIFTEMVSIADAISSGLFSGDPLLLSEMPEISWVRTSLWFGQSPVIVCIMS